MGGAGTHLPEESVEQHELPAGDGQKHQDGKPGHLVDARPKHLVRVGPLALALQTFLQLRFQAFCHSLRRGDGGKPYRHVENCREERFISTVDVSSPSLFLSFSLGNRRAHPSEPCYRVKCSAFRRELQNCHRASPRQQVNRNEAAETTFSVSASEKIRAIDWHAPKRSRRGVVTRRDAPRLAHVVERLTLAC